MSKSILIIDTPENCSARPLFIGSYTDMTCRGNGRTIDYPFPDNKIQDWCPLKEVPEKYDVVSMNFERGYNACIDEILKEGD